MASHAKKGSVLTGNTVHGIFVSNRHVTSLERNFVRWKNEKEKAEDI